nr:MAG: nonstructural polyprotein [Lake Sinai virus 8]
MKGYVLLAFSLLVVCNLPPVSHWIEDAIDDYNTMCSYEYAAADAYNTFVHRHRVAAYAAGVRVRKHRAPWYCFASKPVPVVHPFSWLMSQYDESTTAIRSLLGSLGAANATLSEGVRAVADVAFKAYIYYQIVWAQLLTIVTVVGFFLALICSSRVRVVRIRNRVCGYDVQALRRDFDVAGDSISLPPSRGHSCLSFQRRVVESWCADQLLRYFNRFRLISGASHRLPECDTEAHRCAPTVQGGCFVPDEFLRPASCRRAPAACPERYEIPAALLSHVDYYMTTDQLAAVVTGPTFIVNHDYGNTDSLSVAEAHASCVSGLVQADVRDGPTFGPHPYYDWADEGTVVARTGAFKYYRVGRMFDTSVYYAFPLAGTYSDDDPSALRRSTDGDLHYYSPHEKRFVSYTAGPSHYRVFGVDLPRALADYCAATFCRSVRDDKFYDSLRSYYQNRCRALGFSDARDTLMLDFIIHLCDEASLRTFGFSRLSCAPSSCVAYWLSWVLVKINHVMPLALTTYCLAALHRFFGAKSAPWNWATIHLPTYDMVATPFRLKLFGRNPTLFNLERFRAEASIVGAPDLGQSAEGACQDHDKYGVESGDTCASSCSTTSPTSSSFFSETSQLLLNSESLSNSGASVATSAPSDRGSGLQVNSRKTGRKSRRSGRDNARRDHVDDVLDPKRTTHDACPDPTASCGPHFFMSVRDDDESVPTLLHAHSDDGQDITFAVDDNMGEAISKRYSASQLRLLSWAVDGVFNVVSRSASPHFVEESLLSLLRFLLEVPTPESCAKTRRCLLFGGPRQRFSGYDTFDIGFMGIAVPHGKTKGVEACLREVARQHARADRPN